MRAWLEWQSSCWVEKVESERWKVERKSSRLFFTFHLALFTLFLYSGSQRN
jgi:hypothetical protein